MATVVKCEKEKKNKRITLFPNWLSHLTHKNLIKQSQMFCTQLIKKET